MTGPRVWLGHECASLLIPEHLYTDLTKQISLMPDAKQQGAQAIGPLFGRWNVRISVNQRSFSWEHPVSDRQRAAVS